MARKAVSIGLVLLFILSIAAPVYCNDPIKKLGRGACNVATCIIEWPKAIKEVNETDGAFASLTYGFLKGVGKMCIRAGVGLFEIATFPIPIPKEYRPILTDPEFFFSEEVWT